MPRSASSSFTCRLTAACDTASSSAASVKLPSRPAASKVLSAVKGNRPRFIA
nr:hypothetical protein [Roseateles sp. XES5]